MAEIEICSRTISDDDIYIRAFFSRASRRNHWTERGELSPVAFMKSVGLSCELKASRSDEEVVRSLKSYLTCEYAMAFCAHDCDEVDIYRRWEESEFTDFHYCLYKNPQLELLSIGQANHLREHVRCVYHDPEFPPYGTLVVKKETV